MLRMREGEALAKWFLEHARDLPWRREPRDPYHVLVSELMLQQTQVERVVPKFLDFVARFPTIMDLADAEENDVLEQWSGLGYYRRARLLHRLARRVVEMGGVIPNSVDELRKLPGIGPYTAAAVASFAFGRREVTLDGNVRRVAARFLASAQTGQGADARFTEWILGLMDMTPPGLINEGLIELGATVCRPAQPDCSRCPLQSGCRARRLERQTDFPAPRAVRKPVRMRWVTACAFSADGRILVTRVDAAPILQGMWLPPWFELDGTGRDDDGERARSLLPCDVHQIGPGPAVSHSVTYRRIRIEPFVYELKEECRPGKDWKLVSPDHPGVPTSSLLAKLAGSCQPVWIEWRKGLNE